MAHRIDYGRLVAGGIGLVVLGMFVVGYGIVVWHSPTSCGGATMSAGDRCAVTEVDGKHRESLLNESTYATQTIPLPDGNDWDTLKPRDKIHTTTVWDTILDAKNARTFDEQRAATIGNARVMVVCGALTVALGATMARWARRRRSA